MKNNSDDFKSERLAHLFTIWHDYDVICLQEMFSFASSRIDTLLQKAKSAGFLYSIHSRKTSLLRGQIIDGGLVILSRFPIRSSKEYVLDKGSGIDGICAKGFLWARIQLSLQPLFCFDIVTLHLQASYETSNAILGNNDHNERARWKQVETLRSKLLSLLVQDSGHTVEIPPVLPISPRPLVSANQQTETSNSSQKPVHIESHISSDFPHPGPSTPTYSEHSESVTQSKPATSTHPISSSTFSNQSESTISLSSSNNVYEKEHQVQASSSTTGTVQPHCNNEQAEVHSVTKNSLSSSMNTAHPDSVDDPSELHEIPLSSERSEQTVSISDSPLSQSNTSNPLVPMTVSATNTTSISIPPRSSGRPRAFSIDVPPLWPLLIVGDFNVNSLTSTYTNPAVYSGLTDKTSVFSNSPVFRSRDQSQSMPQFHPNQQTSSQDYLKLRNFLCLQPYFTVDDVFFSNWGFHSPTFADIMLDDSQELSADQQSPSDQSSPSSITPSKESSSPNIRPRETVLTDKSEWKKPQCLDYIFYCSPTCGYPALSSTAASLSSPHSPRGSPLPVPVEQSFICSKAIVEPFFASDTPFSQLSDHYGLSADFIYHASGIS